MKRRIIKFLIMLLGLSLVAGSLYLLNTNGWDWWLVGMFAGGLILFAFGT